MWQPGFSKSSHSMISHPTHPSCNMTLTFFSLRCRVCVFLNMGRLKTVAAKVTPHDFQGKVTSTRLSWDGCFWKPVTMSGGSPSSLGMSCVRNESSQLKPGPSLLSRIIILKVDLWALSGAAPPDARWRGDKLLAKPGPNCRFLSKANNCLVRSHYVLGWLQLSETA